MENNKKLNFNPCISKKQFEEISKNPDLCEKIIVEEKIIAEKMFEKSMNILEKEFFPELLKKIPEKNKKICCACGKLIPKNHPCKKIGKNYYHSPACVVY